MNGITRINMTKLIMGSCLIQAAITTCLNTTWLVNNTNLVFIVLEPGKSKINATAETVPGEDP
jgi:hypothetical protein